MHLISLPNTPARAWSTEYYGIAISSAAGLVSAGVVSGLAWTIAENHEHWVRVSVSSTLVLAEKAPHMTTLPLRADAAAEEAVHKSVLKHGRLSRSSHAKLGAKYICSHDMHGDTLSMFMLVGKQATLSRDRERVIQSPHEGRPRPGSTAAAGYESQNTFILLTIYVHSDFHER
jgi:hypothetical protein